MTCSTLNRRSTDYIDDGLRPSERARVEGHLRRCGACDSRIQELKEVRSGLRSLPPVKSPSSLRTRLLIAASQQRKVVLEADGSRLRLTLNDWKFRFRELMRPFTIPATGGLCSSLILFGALAFTIGTSTRLVSYDVPVVYASSDRVDGNLIPMELRSSIVLTLSLDGDGHITDYAARATSGSFVGDAMSLQHNNGIDVPRMSDARVSNVVEGEPDGSGIEISLTAVGFRP